MPQAGDLVLLYPEWLPGAHSPRGVIKKVAGLKFTAGGKPLTWRRDPPTSTPSTSTFRTG